jgi:hypothetical protein
MTEHPITPPPELVQQWRNLPEYVSQLRMMSSVTLTTEKLQDIATQAARWGADQELEACCEWFVRDWTDIETADKLRAARRPKPPSLKEQALEALDRMWTGGSTKGDWELFRRALEALPE